MHNIIQSNERHTEKCMDFRSAHEKNVSEWKEIRDSAVRKHRKHLSFNAQAFWIRPGTCVPISKCYYKRVQPTVEQQMNFSSLFHIKTHTHNCSIVLCAPFFHSLNRKKFLFNFFEFSNLLKTIVYTIRITFWYNETAHIFCENLKLQNVVNYKLDFNLKKCSLIFFV